MIMVPSQLSFWAIFCNCFYPEFNTSSKKQMISIQQWSAGLGYISFGAMLYIPLIISFVKNGAPTIHPWHNLPHGETTTIIIPYQTISLLSFDQGLFWVVLFCLWMFLIPVQTLLMFLSLCWSNYDIPKRKSQCGIFLTEFFGCLTVWICFVSPIIACLSAINLTTYYVSDSPLLRVILFIISWLALAISVLLFWPLGFYINQFIHLFQGAVPYYQLLNDFQNRDTLVTPEASGHFLGRIYPISDKSFREIIAHYKRCMACFAFVETAALLYLPCIALFIKNGAPKVHPNLSFLDQPSFVPSLTEDLRSFDHGLFWVTLWAVWMLLIPVFTLMLVVSLCCTYCDNLKRKNNCAICVTVFIGRLVIYTSIFSPLFASLSGTNFISYYTADTPGFYIALLIVAWLGLLLSLLIYIPLAVHIYSFAQFFLASITYYQLSDKISWETEAPLPEGPTTPSEGNTSPRTDFYNERKPLV